MIRTVEKIMETDVYTCTVSDTLGDCTRIMIEHGISSLPIIDEEKRVVGFISDGDIMRAIAEHKARPIFSGDVTAMLYYDNDSFEDKVEALKVRNVMELATTRVLCATPDQTVGKIANTLSKKKFKKLPVVDNNGVLVGVIRRTSIMRCIFETLFHEEAKHDIVESVE